MTLQNTFKFAAIIDALSVTAFLIVLLQGARFAGASAPPGAPGYIATSSNPLVVPNTAIVLISTSTCNARIISTATTTLMLTFTDKDTPTGTFGTLQAASTTVVYDSGQYGCGQIRGMSNSGGYVTVIDVR